MKLQLKRSNVLDGGKAKEPTPPYVEYGELCVNYNVNDPALFIKDSNDNIIRIAGKNSVGSGSNPSGPNNPGTGNNIGDVFFNTGDLILYYWDGNQWVPIASQEHAADIYVGTFAEVDVEIPVAERRNGLLLWETEEGNLFLWYIDADTAQWVVAVPGGGSGGGGGGGSNVTVLDVAPNNPEQGDLWYCTNDGRLYIYYQDVNTSQWVDASPDNLSEGFWERDGTTLKPVVAGDDVDLVTGDLSANNIVAADDVQTTSLNGGPLAGMRNQIINGGFEVFQRGAGPFTGLEYTADRWFKPSTALNVGITSIGNNVIDSDGNRVPFTRCAYGDAQSSTDHFVLVQPIELPRPGFQAPFVSGNTMTVSFWVRSTVATTASTFFVRTYFNDGVNGANLVGAQEITNDQVIDTTWRRLSFTFDIPDVSASITNSENCFVVNIRCENVESGRNYQLTGVQLEPGPVATPFEHRPIGTELALCQRYFTRMDSNVYATTWNCGVFSTRGMAQFFYPVEMRVAPKVEGALYTNATELSAPQINKISTVFLTNSTVTGSTNCSSVENATFDAEL